MDLSFIFSVIMTLLSVRIIPHNSHVMTSFHPHCLFLMIYDLNFVNRKINHIMTLQMYPGVLTLRAEMIKYNLNSLFI